MIIRLGFIHLVVYCLFILSSWPKVSQHMRDRISKDKSCQQADLIQFLANYSVWDIYSVISTYTNIGSV